MCAQFGFGLEALYQVYWFQAYLKAIVQPEQRVSRQLSMLLVVLGCIGAVFMSADREQVIMSQPLSRVLAAMPIMLTITRHEDMSSVASALVCAAVSWCW